jgi:hypothetical protein
LAGTNYLGVSGTNAETRDGLFTSNQRVRLEHIVDGSSQTLLVGERGYRAEALDNIDDSDDMSNLRFGMWFSAPGQVNGSVGVVLGTRELNYGTGLRRLTWERDCPAGPYRFIRPGQIRDATNTVRRRVIYFISGAGTPAAPSCTPTGPCISSPTTPTPSCRPWAVGPAARW